MCSNSFASAHLCLIYFKISLALAILLEHMLKKFEINRTKIKGGCHSGRKVVPHDSESDLPLVDNSIWRGKNLLLLGMWFYEPVRFPSYDILNKRAS